MGGGELKPPEGSESILMFLGIYIKNINSLSQNISNNLHPARQAYWRVFTLLARVHTGEKSKNYQKSIHTPQKNFCSIYGKNAYS